MSLASLDSELGIEPKLPTRQLSFALALGPRQGRTFAFANKVLKLESV